MEAVTAMTELLLASPLDPTQARYAEMLYQSSRSLLGVLNDVLDFSRLDGGRMELQHINFDLHDLVQGVGTVLQTRANDKGLTGGVDVGANCPSYVVGDAARLRQILMSFIENALRFTSVGSVRLYANASETDGRLVLRFDVTDTGVGLSKAVQERLFLPFVEIDKQAGEVGSTGLGLAIAKKLASLMGGEVGCESVVGQGTLYWLTLPAGRVQMSAPALRASKDASPQGVLSGHVLLLEDNAVNRMLIGSYLDEFGLTNEVASNGDAAVLSLAAKTYDLVLMDTAMRDLDGVETVKRIRSLQAPSSQVPIVALFANGLKVDAGAYLAAGIEAYVSKPIRGRELYAALSPFLGVARDEPVLRLVKG
jgi:CheY-like chemotaxis protein